MAECHSEQASQTFVYDIPLFVHPEAFVLGMNALLPGVVKECSGRTVTLYELRNGYIGTRAALEEVINPGDILSV